MKNNCLLLEMTRIFLKEKKKEHLNFSVTPGSEMKHLHKETRPLNERIWKYIAQLIKPVSYE